MTVPSNATSKNREAMLRSFRIADIAAEHIELVEESTATIYNYAYDNLDKLQRALESSGGGMSKTVAFIDIGHCKTSLTVVKF